MGDKQHRSGWNGEDTTQTFYHNHQGGFGGFLFARDQNHRMTADEQVPLIYGSDLYLTDGCHLFCFANRKCFFCLGTEEQQPDRVHLFWLENDGICKFILRSTSEWSKIRSLSAG